MSDCAELKKNLFKRLSYTFKYYFPADFLKINYIFFSGQLLVSEIFNTEEEVKFFIEIYLILHKNFNIQYPIS